MKILNNINKIPSFLPVFSGFYESIFSADEDMVIEHPYTYDDYEFDYEGYHTKVAKLCVNAIENKLKEFGFNITVVYEKINSPKYYNFETDAIYCTYKLNKGVKKALNDYLKNNIEAFEKYIKERYTSRSGFSSHYDNDVNTWLTFYLNNENKVNHCFGSLLEFIFRNEKYNDYELYDDCNIHGEMYLEGWLKKGCYGVNEKIEEFANDNYIHKNVTEIVSELVNYFESESIEFDWLTYDYIEEIVNNLFKTIEDKTLNLFAE